MTGIRRVTPGDRDRLREWRNRPEVARWMFTDHQITQDEHNSWFERMLDDPSQRYWVVSWDDVPVGIVNITDINLQHRRCSWGIYLAEPGARGTGAAEGACLLSLNHAFDGLGLGRVMCETLHDNRRAIALYERIGFRREGYHRAHVWRGGESFDVVSFGLLATDWATLRPGHVDRLRARGALNEGEAGG